MAGVTGKTGKARRVKVGNPDPEKLAHLIASNAPMTDQQKIIAAGYSPKTTSTHVIKSAKVQRALKSLDQVRADYRQKPGYRFEDQLKAYNKLSRGKAKDYSNKSPDNIPQELYVPATARLKALERKDALLGYNAPNELNVRTASLIADLRDISSNELGELRAFLGISSDNSSDVEIGEAVSD